MTISELDITLNAGGANGDSWESIDNVVLNATTPEPTSLALFGTGSAVLWFLRRRMLPSLRP